MDKLGGTQSIEKKTNSSQKMQETSTPLNEYISNSARETKVELKLEAELDPKTMVTLFHS